MDDAVPELTPEVLPAGLDGLLVRFHLSPHPAAIAAAQVMAARLQADPPPETAEICPALVSVLLRIDQTADRAGLSVRLLAEARRVAMERPPLPQPVRRWTIPAAFGGADGPDLGRIATAMGRTEDAALAELLEADLRVLAIGFAPGQPYLGLLPPNWNLQRLPQITPEVPAGAIVVALRQIVVFGAPSPTGWQQLGRTAFRSFLSAREPPMVLRAGDALRFVRVAPDALPAAEDGGGLGGARLERLA